jgi:hypothetical protein
MIFIQKNLNKTDGQIRCLRPYLVPGCKVFGCHIGCHMGVSHGVFGY